MNILEFSKKYHEFKPGLSPNTYISYSIIAFCFQRYFPRCTMKSLTEKKLREFVSHRTNERSAATVNKERRSILALWETAFEFDYHKKKPVRNLVKKVPENPPTPTAWSTQQVGRILRACEQYESRRGWTGQHWRAFILTIYDTAHRVDAALKLRWDQLENDKLVVDSRQMKSGRKAIIHRLHSQTLKALSLIEFGDELVFPWPFCRRQIFEQYKKILKVAKLPATSRDMFHRLRRTSYTQVFDRLGVAVATDHAGHSSDLSRFYADPAKIRKVFGTDCLERPIS